MRIALLEDDPSQAELMLHWLAKAEHSCQHYESGREFLRAVTNDTFDLLILDWMLPDIDGIEVLGKLRSMMDWDIPILFVTSKDTEEDIIEALEAGADDYMIKPVRSGELFARLKALGRRTGQKAASGVEEYPPFIVDTAAGTISRDGKAIEMTHKEFDLAYFLFRNCGRILSRGYILESVWGRNPDLNTRTVDTHVSRLRNKLGLADLEGWKLTAIYQHGYRLERLDTGS